MVKNVMAAVMVTEMPKMIANEQVMVYSPIASPNNYGSILLGESSDDQYYFTEQSGVLNLNIEKVKKYLAANILDQALSAAELAVESAKNASSSEYAASNIADDLRLLLKDASSTIEGHMKDAQEYAIVASNSALAANASQFASKESETNAKISEENAITSENNARVSEEKAKASEEKITASAATLDRLTDEVALNNKRLTNIEKGLPAESFVTDASTAYVKRVPANVLPYAAIAKVGGMTRKSKNLCHVASVTTAEAGYGGINLPITVQGTYTLSCDVTKFEDDTATNTRVAIRFNYTDGTDSMALGAKDTDNLERDGITRHKSVTGTADTARTLASITVVTLDRSSAGDTRNAKADNIQLEYGSVETEYEPYFEGLRSAPVTEVRSAGRNLANIHGFSAIAIGLGISNAYGTNISTTDASNSVTVTQTAFSSPNNIGSYDNGYFCIVVDTDLQDGEKFTFSCDVQITENLSDGDYAMSVRPCGNNGVKVTVASGRIVANGTWSTDGSREYVEIRLGGKSGVFSNFMLERGHTDGTYTPYREPVVLSIPEAVQDLEGYGEGNPNDATEYNYIDFDRQEFVKMGHIVDGEWVRDESVADISDRLSVDNLLPVEGGGTITAVNDHGYEVPSEIIYQLKGVAE